MKRILALLLALGTTHTMAEWDDMTTAAAMGYCLASHPYRTVHTGPYTPDGFEIVSPPGVVGAVRRNFVYGRSTEKKDEGRDNSCRQACYEFGTQYGPSLVGVPLTQQVRGGGVINSGIGDMASLALSDFDFYLNHDVTAGIWSRGNTFHESDVAQADFCCCQAVRG